MTEGIKKYCMKHGFSQCAPLVALFDMDGVLYDSMWNHAESWHESMKKYNLDMSKRDAFAFEGMRGVETIQLITARQWGKPVSMEEAEEMYRYKSEVFAKKIPAGLIPGVHEALQALHEHGVLIGVVTGSGQPTLISRILDDFNGLVCPEVIVTATDVTQGKPAPDPYLCGMAKAEAALLHSGKLATRMRLQPWQVMVVENAPLGIKAAAAARCFTVAVNTGPQADDELASAGADVVMQDMDELKESLTEVIK